MDTTQTIILTSIVNIIITGLVGGIVIYRIQKKIDATIQKSLFEHQTRFTRNYAKTVETLESLYKKLAVYRQGFRELAFEAISFHRDGRKPLKVDIPDYENGEQKLDEFYNYFEENRFTLPSDLFPKITDIFVNVKTMHQSLAIALPFYRFDDRWALLRLSLQGRLGFEIDWEKLDYQSVIYKMMSTVDGQAKILEDLYKSAAAAKGEFRA